MCVCVASRAAVVCVCVCVCLWACAHWSRRAVVRAQVSDAAGPTWSPAIDGTELPSDPWSLAAAGAFAPHVGALLGSNHDEGTAFTPSPHNITGLCSASASRRPAAHPRARGITLAHAQRRSMRHS
jgi:hypothetical protein